MELGEERAEKVSEVCKIHPSWGAHGHPEPAVRPILIVEDNDDTRRALAMLLSLEGYSVATAEDGLSGLRVLLEQRPSLVLLDLTMPRMDGWEFREEQRSLPDASLAAVPVIVLTALSDAGRHARDLGAVGFIQKPIEFTALLEAVRRYCGKPGSPDQGPKLGS